MSTRRSLARSFGGADPFYSNLNVVFTLRSMPFWSNAVLKLRRSSDNATAYVFNDGASAQDNITLSSYISTSSNTTPSTTTLSTWVGSDDAFVEEWIGKKTDNTISSLYIASQTITGRQPQFISSGTIITKNSKPTVDFLSTTRTLWSNNGMPFATNTDEFTVLTVSALNALNTIGFAFRVYHPTSEYFGVTNDSRTTFKRNTVLVTSGGSYFNDNLAIHNSTDLKLISSIKSTTFTRSYYNTVFQQEVAQDGLSYSNSRYVIGAFSDTTSYNIKVSEVMIFKDASTADISARHTNINDYYGI